MTIQGGNIHNILRTYNKQIKYGKLSELDSNNKDKSKELDKVTLSPDAKKVMFISNLISEPIENKQFTSDDVEDFLSKNNVDFSKVSNDELNKLKEDFLEYIS